tara:strand:- start:958 stop:1566 length:609 start_codon:yes stop_codon:yes gene_type:complete
MIDVKQIPNFLTICRILVIFPTLWFLYFSQFREAFYLLVIAGISDALDGYLARAFDWKTRLGSILDPIADKFLIASCFLVLAIQSAIPTWVAVIVLGRDLVIFGGAIAYRVLYKELEIAPTMLSKINTAFQIIALTVIVFYFANFPLFTTYLQLLLDPYLFVTLAALGVLSGIQYVVVWTRKALNQRLVMSFVEVNERDDSR